MKTDAILAVDLGTTAVKAVVFDLAGGVLGEGQQEYPTCHPRPGVAEQEPEDWWMAVAAATRQATASAAGARVMAIGLSAQRETVVPVDGAGRPLRPAMVWMDRRSQPQANDLAARLGATAVHSRTGMLPEATFTGTKLRYLTETEPDVVRQARWFLQPKDYLVLRLTGAPALDPTLASRTLLWSIRDGWEADLLAWAGIRPDQLPPVVPSGAAPGRLTAKAAATLGLPPGIPVAAGAGDRCCEALGAGVTPVPASQGAPGCRVMVSTGTATNVSGVLDRIPSPLVGGVLYTRHAVPGQWLAEQGISAGGSVLRWFRDTLGHVGYDELNRLAGASSPGAGGLLILPYFMGARATRWNPTARGAWLGLTLGHTPGDLARSIMEGVALEVRACLEVLGGAGQAPTELVMLGGGANSPLWCQIKADVTGVPVVVPRVTSAACLGAMFLGGQAAGLWTDPVAAARSANPIVKRFEPDPSRHAFYGRLYSLYNRLYSAVAPLYDELTALAVVESEN